MVTRAKGSSLFSRLVTGHRTELATCTVNPERPGGHTITQAHGLGQEVRTSTVIAVQTTGRKLGYVRAASPGLACCRVTGPPGPQGPEDS